MFCSGGFCQRMYLFSFYNEWNECNEWLRVALFIYNKWSERNEWLCIYYDFFSQRAAIRYIRYIRCEKK